MIGQKIKWRWKVEKEEKLWAKVQLERIQGKFFEMRKKERKKKKGENDEEEEKQGIPHTKIRNSILIDETQN